MKVLRSYKDLELNEGDGMARGLFNVSSTDNVSLWFDAETKNDLLAITNEEFEDECIELIYSITK